MFIDLCDNIVWIYVEIQLKNFEVISQWATGMLYHWPSNNTGSIGEMTQRFPEYFLFILILRISFKLEIDVKKTHLFWIYVKSRSNGFPYQTGLFTAAVVKLRVLCQPKTILCAAKDLWKQLALKLTQISTAGEKPDAFSLKEKKMIHSIQCNVTKRNGMECISDDNNIRLWKFRYSHGTTKK